jgi:hypothetical protein
MSYMSYAAHTAHTAHTHMSYMSYAAPRMSYAAPATRMSPRYRPRTASWPHRHLHLF